MDDYDELDDEEDESPRREDDDDALTFMIADDHARQWREARGGSCCSIALLCAVAVLVALIVAFR